MGGREPVPCMDELHRNFVQMSGMGRCRDTPRVMQKVHGRGQCLSDS